ncbi:MAG: DUF2867 domain-containing protein [Desulfobacterales bacterium]
MKAPVLVTGATGYVGGRLVPALLACGHRVRALARSLEKLARRPWYGRPGIEPVRGDLLDRDSLTAALSGCEAVFYLVHSMIAQGSRFAEADRAAARNLASAAAAAGVRRILYLGGLAAETGGPLSHHLASRLEVARILSAGSVPVTELRAPMILGSGSASFEILRYLVERLPVMTTPRWVRSQNQPIAISNVIGYLTGCLEREGTAGASFDIGGPDRITYEELFRIYAEEAGLRRRLILPVPVLSPRLSALWIHLVTPVPRAIALPLAEGLTSDAVCRETRIREVVPQRLLSCREAIRLALERLPQELWNSCWGPDGGLLPFEWPYCGDADYAGGTRLQIAYRLRVRAEAEGLWRVLSRLGGKGGYFAFGPLWRLRGAIDRQLGGRGLADSAPAGGPAPGLRFDFWRVLAVEPPRRLCLLSEMKAPGEALFELEIEEGAGGCCELRLISRFLPRGLAGLLYCSLLEPVHRAVFRGMLLAIAAAAGGAVSPPERFSPRPRPVCFLPDLPGLASSP